MMGFVYVKGFTDSLKIWDTKTDLANHYYVLNHYLSKVLLAYIYTAC